MARSVLEDDEPLILEATAAMPKERGCEALAAARQRGCQKARTGTTDRSADNRYQYARDGWV